MAKRILNEGRAIDGKLYQKGAQIELKADDEKALEKAGVLEPKAKAEPKVKAGDKE